MAPGTQAANRPQIGTDIALQHTASMRRSTMRYVALLLLFTSTALARDNGQWNNSPINIREWFQSLMQPDNPYMSSNRFGTNGF